MKRTTVSLKGKNIATITALTGVYEMNLLESTGDKVEVPTQKIKKFRQLGVPADIDLGAELTSRHSVETSTDIEIRPRNLTAARKIGSALILFGHKYEVEPDNMRIRVLGTTLGELSGFLFDQGIINEPDHKQINQTLGKAKGR
jgi:hypothetical protein